MITRDQIEQTHQNCTTKIKINTPKKKKINKLKSVTDLINPT